jgi:hypothetical protein
MNQSSTIIIDDYTNDKLPGVKQAVDVHYKDIVRAHASLGIVNL